MAKAKAMVDQQIAQERGVVTQACDAAKAKIQQLNGPKNAAKRAAHLKAAIKFCQHAQSIVDHEKKVDYAALDKATAAALKQHAAPAGKPAPAADPGQRVASGIAKVEHVNAVATGMVAKTTKMCRAMQSKVHVAAQQGAFRGHPHAEAKLLHAATAFCSKAKEMVTRELGKNRATLARGMRVAHNLGVESAAMGGHAREAAAKEKAAKVASEKAAEKVHEKERLAKGKKIETASYAHEVAAAKAMHASMLRNQKKFGVLKEKLTRKKMAVVKRQMRTNASSRRIMRNIKSLGQSRAAIEAVLQEFALMEDEATLMSMPGSVH